MGALSMLSASLVFAAANTLQSILPQQFGMSSTGMAFWQYLIASALMAPVVMRIGLGKLKTRHPLAHQARAFASALGVHVFVYGFASGVPIWQMVTLLATGPLFVIVGSTLFLGERVSGARLGAAGHPIIADDITSEAGRAAQPDRIDLARGDLERRPLIGRHEVLVVGVPLDVSLDERAVREHGDTAGAHLVQRTLDQLGRQPAPAPVRTAVAA